MQVISGITDFAGGRSPARRCRASLASCCHSMRPADVRYFPLLVAPSPRHWPVVRLARGELGYLRFFEQIVIVFAGWLTAEDPLEQAFEALPRFQRYRHFVPARRRVRLVTGDLNRCADYPGIQAMRAECPLQVPRERQTCHGMPQGCSNPRRMA